MTRGLGEGISSKLWLLSKEIIETAKEAKEAGQIVKTKTMYVQQRCTHLGYVEGSISYQLSTSFVEKEEWHWKSRYEFLEKVVKKLSRYGELAAEISGRYHVSGSQADFWLSRFAQALSAAALNGIGEEALADYVTTFVKDLEKAPVEWKLTIWVQGVWLADEEFVVHEGLRLRRPGPTDLDSDQPFEALPMGQMSENRELTSAAMELIQVVRDQKEFQDEIAFILTALRLFRLGGVGSIRTEMHAKSFLAFGGTIWSGGLPGATYTYGLKREDISGVKELIERLRASPIAGFVVTAPQEVNPLWIALRRYNDALLKPESIEGQITLAITCLEALFLKAQERMELSHRLGQRVSIVLSNFGHHPIEVYNDIDRAYEIRSAYIHGSQVNTEQLKGAGELAPRILDYARKSLLIFLQMQPTIDKEALISKMDNALLDPNALAKVGKLLSENCRLYG